MNRSSARKGSAQAIIFVDNLRQRNIFQFTIDEAIEYFTLNGDINIWNQDSNAKDPHGLRRALGDLFGAHGLQLPSTVSDGKKYYIIPRGLHLAQRRCRYLYDVQLVIISVENTETITLQIVAGPDAFNAVEKAKEIVLYKRDPEKVSIELLGVQRNVPVHGVVI